MKIGHFTEDMKAMPSVTCHYRQATPTHLITQNKNHVFLCKFIVQYLGIPADLGLVRFVLPEFIHDLQMTDCHLEAAIG